MLDDNTGRGRGGHVVTDRIQCVKTGFQLDSLAQYTRAQLTTCILNSDLRGIRNAPPIRNGNIASSRGVSVHEIRIGRIHAVQKMVHDLATVVV